MFKHDLKGIFAFYRKNVVKKGSRKKIADDFWRKEYGFSCKSARVLLKYIAVIPAL